MLGCRGRWTHLGWPSIGCLGYICWRVVVEAKRFHEFIRGKFWIDLAHPCIPVSHRGQLVTPPLPCALCYLFRTNPRPRKHNNVGPASKMSVGDTRLNNTHAVVLGHLQQIHQAELVSTKAKLHHVSHALKSITELCQSDGITFTRCDGCRATHFADDLFRCEDCHMRSCYACNSDALAGGEVTVTGDRIYDDRAELCRDCREMRSLDEEEEEGSSEGEQPQG